MGVARRCGERARLCCDADVGVPNGDVACGIGGGGVNEEPLAPACLIGETLGEGGGVGVTE